MAQRNWHFIILLDDTWGFDPNGISLIKVTVESDTEAGFGTFDNLLFGFTTDNTRYVSASVAMANKGENNMIYPNCQTTPRGQQKAFGNIATLPQYDRGCDIAAGTCSNWKPMNPRIANEQGPVHTNAFPISWTLTDDPRTDTLTVSYSSAAFPNNFIQRCYFTAFPTGSGFKIYVAANEIGHTLSINAFQIESIWSSGPSSPSAPSRPTPSPSMPTNLPPTNMPSRVCM